MHAYMQVHARVIYVDRRGAYDTWAPKGGIRAE